MLRRFVILGVLVTGAGCLFIVWLLLALPPLCGKAVVQQAVSPDGRYRASVSEGSCGATTGVATYITMERNFDSLLAKEADVLIADGDRARLETSVQWAGPRRLVVSWRGSEQVFLAETELFGVSVDYVAL
ncbi:hypothetical protein [Pelagibius sp. 7325]|uniref:hypothetical protein n=1 Tax=Pelagibius sp. 7325 TaxID=3131994 RepID=UPI0030EF2B2A